MDKLQAMAEAFAASIPPYLDKPTLPPIAWAQAGETVIVILADGRKMHATVQEINTLMFPVGATTGRPEIDQGDQDMKGKSSPYPIKVKSPPPPKPATKGGTKKK